jgi:hypothetical protein
MVPLLGSKSLARARSLNNPCAAAADASLSALQDVAADICCFILVHTRLYRLILY